MVENFLKEDIGEGDITTNAIVPENHTSKAIIQAKANGVVAGHIFVREIFKFLDTRKTSPGLRSMEKYAVRMGGGYNHRLNLSEMALIKENHIALAGSIKEAVKRVKSQSNVPIEVEVRNMEELKEAIDAGVG